MIQREYLTEYDEYLHGKQKNRKAEIKARGGF